MTPAPKKADLDRCLNDVAALVATALVETNAGRASFASLHLALTRCAARIGLLKLDLHPEMLELGKAWGDVPPAE